MKEVFTMWRYTKMVVLTALTAALYSAILIPLKGIPIIPGFTEFRPASVIPVLFGILFGPAGAWGSAFGNLIGDFFGTLSIGSLFGFIGNFFFGLTGYKVRGKMGIFSKKNITEFILISIISSSICAVIIAWGLELFGLFPFSVIASIITLNNSLASIIIGPFLFILTYPRAERLDLLWIEIMDEKDRQKSISPNTGVFLMWLGAIGGLISGIAISSGFYSSILSSPVIPVSFFILIFILGCLLA